jgi:restriction endonuclease S subunit
LDKSLAKKTDKILFVKIENDGFGLGAQRKELPTSDLPDAVNFVKQYITAVRNNDYSSIDFEKLPLNSLVINKSEIAKNEDYNLDLVSLGDLCSKITKGTTPTTNGFNFVENGINFIKIESITDSGGFIKEKFAFIDDECHNSLKRSQLKENDILFSIAGALGRVAIVDKDILPANTNQALAILTLNEDVFARYIYWILKSGDILKEIEKLKTGVAQLNLSLTQINEIKIPLPPLSIQQEIVSKIEQYEKIISGAKQVVENYKPQVDINPEWEMVELGSVCDVRDGTHDSPKYQAEGFPLITSKNIKDGVIDFSDVNLISKEDLENINKRSMVDDGDIIMPMIGTIGNPIIIKKDREFAIKNVALIKFHKESKIENRYLNIILSSEYFYNHFINSSSGSTQKFIPLGFIRKLEIPLPSLDEQAAIVLRITKEKQLVNASKELIEVFEQKIKDEINKLWAE